jgi:hypothetical protein
MPIHGSSETNETTIVVIGYVFVINPSLHSLLTLMSQCWHHRSYQRPKDPTTNRRLTIDINSTRRKRMANFNPRRANNSLSRLCLNVGWRSHSTHPRFNATAAS